MNKLIKREKQTNKQRAKAGKASSGILLKLIAMEHKPRWNDDDFFLSFSYFREWVFS